MADPLTLAALSAVALTEGIRFLYGQAGEALKRWRERKDAGPATEPVSAQLPDVAFEGELKDPQLHLDAVKRLEPELRDLRAAVADYAQGIDEVSPGDQRLLLAVDALRRAMEAVYGQPIAFKGEPAPSSAPTVVGEAKVKEVKGYVAGLRAKNIVGGSATGRVESETVPLGGQAVGLEVETIGAAPPNETTERDPKR